MGKPVIAIGLDAADPNLIETWIAEGYLPTLSRLRAEGAYGRLKTYEYYRAETPWTTFLTGCTPQQTGYWAPLKFYADDYSVEEIQAYDFEEYPPFYALLNEGRVAVFDMPQSKLVQDVNGIQVLAWGAHSPMTPSHSIPDSLLKEVTELYGSHPTLREDHAPVLNWNELKNLQHGLETGIQRRAKICQDLLQREPWDFFLTIFGETHSAGHYFWHLSRDNHPLYPYYAKSDDDPMRSVFQTIDKAIADIVSQAPEDATIVVFAAHGMDTNVMDLPSMVFLPELLYRYNFPGDYGLAKGSHNLPDQPVMDLRARQGWIGKVWSLKHDKNPVKRWLRKHLPRKIFEKIEFLFPRPSSDLVSPFELMKESHPLFFQPSLWYRQYWPKMKAFALPSFSEGYVRINLEGREADGVVPLGDYQKVCEEIEQELHRLKDARTGAPMVRKIVRTRVNPLDTDPKLPDADLVVIWQEEYATDTVDSPEFGRIGPLPHCRTGSHRSDGFMIAVGNEIIEGSLLEDGHALDLAPTMFDLLNKPVPSYFSGKSLLSAQVTRDRVTV